MIFEVLKEIIEVAAVTFFSVLVASIVVTGIAAIITDRFFRCDFKGKKGIAQGIVKLAVPCCNALLLLGLYYISV